MTGGAVLPAAGGDVPQQHQLLTFAASWKRTKIMVFYGAGVFLVGTAVSYAQDHKLDLELLFLGLVLVVVGFAVHFGARRHYVAVVDTGLWINRIGGHDLIPFPDIRQVRAQNLDVMFSAPSRRGKLVRSLRPFQRSAACSVRVEWPPERLTRVARGVGRGCLVDQDLILLVSQAKELERALQVRVRRRPPAASHRR
ncbi:MAG: hypothetical protein ACRENY_08950 [Candidatus Dormibacteria bacterium]